jgi:c-di-GMP-binding flagellar brake protein YcgR
MNTERRRSPRVPVRNHSIAVRVSSRVRVLDISPGGALLSGALYPPGMRGELHVPLASTSLSCDVEIRQQQLLAGDTGLESRAGVSFVRLSAADQQALDQFLARAQR